MIEQAVMETARGRWFLLEYARRQRAAETQRLTDAVDRLEAMMTGAASPAAPPIPAVPEEDRAALAERLSDLAWRLREDGADPALCAELEREIAVLRGDGGADADEAAPLAPQTAAPPLATPPWQQPHAVNAGEPGRDPRVKALARLDDLPIAEKLALFC